MRGSSWTDCRKSKFLSVVWHEGVGWVHKGVGPSEITITREVRETGIQSSKYENQGKVNQFVPNESMHTTAIYVVNEVNASGVIRPII